MHEHDAIEKNTPLPSVSSPVFHSDIVQESEESEVNPLDYLRRGLRGKYIATFVLAALLAILTSITAYDIPKPTYETSAMILMTASEERVLFDESNDHRLRMFEAFAKGQTAMMLSTPILERAVTGLRSLRSEYTALTVDDLRKTLAVSRDEGVVRISGEHTDAQLVSDMINALSGAYMEYFNEQSKSNESVRTRELDSRRAH
jgi:uncharacterized protein involved in exopolysaccharide biosynthesis